MESMELRSTRTRLQTGRVIDHCHAPVLARRRRRRALLIRHSRSLLSRRGSSVARDNKLANSVQTHVFDSGSAAGHLSAGKSGQTLLARLVKGEEGGKLRATVACGERARRGGADCFACWLIYHASLA